MQNKILLIGLDGATFDFIKPWVEDGKLPAFKKLMTEGVYGRLESTIPHVTPPAWTSMTTGKNPGKHGIFDFMTIQSKEDQYSMQLYTSHSKKAREIWDYLPGKSTVVNVPLTYPPKKINGKLVTGMYTPDLHSNFTHPLALKKEILSLFPEYKTELKWGQYESQQQKFLDDLYRMTESRIKLFWHLLKKEWDFFFFVFIGTDRIQHLIDDESQIQEYYSYIDTFLGDVLNAIKEENINLFLVSDHGFHKTKKIIHINTLLNHNNYLKRKHKNLGGGGISREKLNQALRKMNIDKIVSRLPQNVLEFSRHVLPGKSNPAYDIDIPNSQAFMVGSGSIFLSTQNDSVKQEIINKVESLTDPETGEKVIDHAFKKEEIYHGSQIGQAPDLVILPRKGYSLAQTLSTHIFEPPSLKKADHAIDGIFIAYGPDIAEGRAVQDAKIFDVAPTILHIYGKSIPREMDGRALKEIFRESSSLARKPIRYNDAHMAEQARVKKAISKLKKNFDE